MNGMLLGMPVSEDAKFKSAHSSEGVNETGMVLFQGLFRYK